MKEETEGTPLEWGNPQEPTNWQGGEVQGGSSEIAKLPQRMERYGRAKARAMENVAWSKTSDQKAVRWAGAKLERCGEYLVMRHYYTVDKVRLHAANFCKQHLICPLCAIRRGAKMLEAYMKRFEVVKAEYPRLKFALVTVTVKNGEHLGERMAHCQNAVRRLLERRRTAFKGNRGKTEWQKVLGGFGSYEVTNKGKGWHPHAHIVVVHEKRLDYAAMQAEWQEVTGDSIFLNVSPGRHPQAPEQDFMEVTKYAVKFGDLTPEQNFVAYLRLWGKRLCFCFGCFRGVVVPESLTDEPLEGLPYIDLFYRYFGSGYSLASTSRSDQETRT